MSDAAVWVRAWGAATPWGGWGATVPRLDAGDTAIREIERFDARAYPCSRAASCAHDLWAEDPRRALSLAALRDAGERGDDGWRAEAERARVGIFWGAESGLARFWCAFAFADAMGRDGAYDPARLAAHPERLGDALAESRTSPATPARALASALRARGPVSTISYACASGAVAVAEGARAIAQGRCQLAICGGVGADVDPLLLSAFGRLGVLSARGVCAPFDQRRDGFALGEGAALVVLSAERGAARVQLAGSGRSLDAASLTAPLTDGAGAARAIDAALRGLDADQVRHVEAHGTGTELNDRAEALALHRALGQGARAVSVSAVKGALGHWIAGAGALGVVAAVTALERARGFPIAGLDELDAECDLPGAGRASAWSAAPGDLALACSFGFGGANAALAFRRAA